MWHWPRSLVAKGYRQFWYQIVVFSLLCHLVLLSIFFFFGGSENINLTIFAKPKAIEVTFVPLYKQAPNLQKQLATAKATSTTKGLNVVRKKSAGIYVPAKKIVAKKNPNQVKQKTKKAEKQEDLKLKHQPVKMKQPEVKKEAPIVNNPANPNPPKSDESTAKQVEVGAAEKAVEQVEQIFVGRKDLKGLQLAQELEEVIGKYWHPPAGFSKDAACEVELVVDNAGRATSHKIKKSSGILAYDISVRQAIPQIVFPESLRSKSLTIVFRQ